MRNLLLILLVDNSPESIPELDSVAARLGLEAQHLPLRRFLGEEALALPEHVHTVVLPTFLGGLEDVFSAVHKLKVANVPRIVVHPSTAWYGSVVLDFQDLGALVLPPGATIEQILQTLDTANAADERSRRRGVTIFLSGSSDPWIASPHGGEQQYILSTGRQRPIFFRLAESPGDVVLIDDLAISADCPFDSVKIYIQRLRERYQVIRQNLGLPISAFSFIEEFGGGYRLNARIKRPI